MSIKLIALDIDDTLLTSQQKIAESTKLALTEALNKGSRSSSVLVDH
jgi:Predicted hydrolases of the HAD superfamily